MKRLTPMQGAILSAYFGELCGELDHLHRLAEVLLARPVLLSELEGEEIWIGLREKAKPFFLRLRHKGVMYAENRETNHHNAITDTGKNI